MADDGRMRRFLVLLVPLLGLGLSLACGSKGDAKSPSEPTATTTGTILPPTPPCNDAPANPGEVVAKEPGVFNACLSGAAKPDPKLCGNAKISVTIGKDGKVSNAQVAESTLPEGVTDCIKARLGAMQFACPKEGSANYTVPVGVPCPGMPPTGGS